MAQQLRTIIVLAEAPSSLPSTHMDASQIPVTPALEGFDAPASVGTSCTHAQHR